MICNCYRLWGFLGPCVDIPVLYSHHLVEEFFNLPVFFYFITHQVGCSQSLFFHWRCLYSPSLWFLLCPSTLACFLHMLPTSTYAHCCPPNQAQGTSHKEGGGAGLACDVLDVPAGQLGGSLGQDASLTGFLMESRMQSGGTISHQQPP